MKGLFIPDITAEMFRNGCLESIEALMAEGEIYDIDYKPEPQWIPCSERLPKKSGLYLVTGGLRGTEVCSRYYNVRDDGGFWSGHPYDAVIAWLPLPKPYQEGEQDDNRRV